jgi:ribosomal protein S18 acetylase RimI-like enzyme
MWINEIAIAPDWRRRGIGQSLLRTLFEVGKAHRCTVTWVLSDRTNEAAIALYSSLGGTEGADDEGPSDATLGFSFALASSHQVPCATVENAESKLNLR